MTVFSVISDAMELCGHSAGSSAINNEDRTVKRFLALLRVEGDALSKYHGWRSLKVRAILTGDGTSTLFDLPADYTRFAPGEVMWEVDGLWQTLKMVTDEEMLALQSDSVSLLRPVWRLFGDQIEFYPAVADGQAINLEYRSAYWLADASLTTRMSRPAADTDVLLVPDHVATLGLVWRFKAAISLTYDEDFRNYQMERERYVFNDASRGKIRISRKYINDGLAAGMYGDIRVIVP